MAVHVEHRVEPLRTDHRFVMAGPIVEAPAKRLVVGIGSGLAGGVLVAAPLVIYDWVRAGHSALELPMAATAWLFGLGHFVQNGYSWWSIVIGAAVLVAYSALSGLVFAGLADAVYGIRSLAGSIAAGVAWSFVSFMLFWYMLLPIARDGAPFRVTAASALSVAPNWVWILGFALFGIATGIGYRVLRRE